jgi:hypothetical protein
MREPIGNRPLSPADAAQDTYNVVVHPPSQASAPAPKAQACPPAKPSLEQYIGSGRGASSQRVAVWTASVPPPFVAPFIYSPTLLKAPTVRNRLTHVLNSANDQHIVTKRISAVTDNAVAAAAASELLADRRQKTMAQNSPELDPLAWKQYTASRVIAKSDLTEAEQAVAAELRFSDQVNLGNNEAIQNVAQSILSRHSDDPAVQSLVTKALHTVKTENAQQRATHIKLYALHQSASNLARLEHQQAYDKSITDYQINSAKKDYTIRQEALLAVVETELSVTRHKVPTVVMLHEVDTSVYEKKNETSYMAQQISARYPDDYELAAAAKAASIVLNLKNSADSGNALQMQELGMALPKGVDPTVKALVMSNMHSQKIIDTYVLNSTNKVRQTYAENGTVAAAQALSDVVNPLMHPAVSPEIAAKVINSSKPTIENIVTDLQQGLPRAQGGLQIARDQQQGSLASFALSQTVDVAAAGSDWERHIYDSPEIQSAVEGVGHMIATHLPAELIAGFRNATANGYVTLALETVYQISQLNSSDLQMAVPFIPSNDASFKTQKELYVNESYQAIENGLRDLKINDSETLNKATKEMAPILAQGRYSPMMTDIAFRHGVQKMVKDDSKLHQELIDGRKSIDEMGYRLVRTSEAVGFYRTKLGNAQGYERVDAARKDLMENEKVTSTILASNSASLRMGAQIARGMLSEDLKNGNSQAQYLGIGAQILGDFTEFMAETYVIGNVNQGVNIPGADIAATRSAHLPYFAGGAIWAMGGGLQALLTKYLFDNVEIGGVGGDLRKALLLGLVGGFAGFHLMQAGMAAVRVQPHTLGNGWMGRLADKADSSWGLYVKEGSVRDRWTKMSVEATPGLIKQLVGLMTLATVWDGSGVFMNVTELNDESRNYFKLGTQGTNLLCDSLLLRLQVREMSLNYLGKKVMVSPELKAAAEKKALAEGAQKLTLRMAGQYAIGESEVQGGATGSAKWLGSSNFLNRFEAVFGNSGLTSETAAWIETMSPTLRSVLFKSAVGAGGEAQIVARFALLKSNPIGWVVNIGYMSTSLGNWAYDHNKNINGFEKYDRTFLEGAGLKPDQADLMGQHNWWSSNAVSDGFLKAYELMGGCPEKFISYVNVMDTNQLELVLQVSKDMDGKQTNDMQHMPSNASAFLALPSDPTKVDIKNTSIVYNRNNGRYEDAATQTYWQGENPSGGQPNIWLVDPSISDTGRLPNSNYKVRAYSPHIRALFYESAAPEQIPINSKDAWQNWMKANNLPLPSSYHSLPFLPPTPSSLTKSSEPGSSMPKPHKLSRPTPAMHKVVVTSKGDNTSTLEDIAYTNRQHLPDQAALKKAERVGHVALCREALRQLLKLNPERKFDLRRVDAVVQAHPAGDPDYIRQGWVIHTGRR